MYGFQFRLLGRLACLMLLPWLVACTSVDLNAPTSEASSGLGADGGAGMGAGAGGMNGVESVQAQADVSPGIGPVNVAHVLYFDLDSYSLAPADQSVVTAHARFLAQNSARSLILEGHTDERGGREYNLALGQKRADAVANALRLLGSDVQRIEAVSFGEEKPEAQGQSEEAYSKNRRVVLRYR